MIIQRKQNPESKPAANEQNTKEEMRAFKNEKSASLRMGHSTEKLFPHLTGDHSYGAARREQ